MPIPRRSASAWTRARLATSDELRARIDELRATSALEGSLSSVRLTCEHVSVIVSGMERWRKVPNLPYEVSSAGRVRRVGGWVVRRVYVPGRLRKVSTDKYGYGVVTVSYEGKISTVRINRLVCAAFHGPAPSRRHQAAHADGTRRNNRAKNLSWKSPKQNEQDKRKHGTYFQPNSKAGKARAKGLNPNIVRVRLQRGWSMQRALSTPSRLYRGNKRQLNGASSQH